MDIIITVKAADINAITTVITAFLQQSAGRFNMGFFALGKEFSVKG